jgi:hypothetical protein
MVDRKDVSDVIASALNEVGVKGTLDVIMDEGENFTPVGEEVEVVVTVRPIGEVAAAA